MTSNLNRDIRKTVKLLHFQPALSGFRQHQPANQRSAAARSQIKRQYGCLHHTFHSSCSGSRRPIVIAASEAA
jgi:hypothetical protein